MSESSADASLQGRAAGFDQIGSELLRALDACRPQCLSLHDGAGDVLWLNAGVIGPDEHGYVLDALDEYSLEPKRTHMQRRLADNRRALFMGARDPSGNCSGLVFVIVDAPGGPEDNQPLSVPLSSLMRRFSMLLAPPPGKQGTKADPQAIVGTTTSSQSLAVEVTELELEPLADTSINTSGNRATTPSAVPLAAQLIDVEVFELEIAADEIPRKAVEPKPVSAKPQPKAAPPETAAPVTEANAVTMVAPVAVRAPNLSVSQSTGQSLPIRARKFVRLQGRGTNRRYQITTIAAAEGQDIRILKATCEWLSLNLDQYRDENASFTVPISAAAALDGRFVAALGGTLTQRSLPEGMVGLLLPSAAWRHPGTAPLLAQCERLRCPITLDDFNLRHDGFQILRSKAIRMVKIDPLLTAPAMNDRFARAALAAITQSARVLGLHCTAKGDISSSGARWLAAAGIDYADPATADAAGAPAPTAAARRSLVQAS